MSLSLEQVWTYLQRIRFPLHDRLPRPDIATLNLVCELHARFVVFENLSLLVPSWRVQDVTAHGLKLDVPSLYNKIVTRGRGGYCFETNVLLSALLTGMGYSVRQGMARVVMDGLQVNPEVATTHLYLMTPHVHGILFVSGGMLPLGKIHVADSGYGGNTLTKPVEIIPKEILSHHTSWEAPADCSIPQFRLRWGKCGTPGCAVPSDVDQGFYMQVWANRETVGTGSWHDLYYFNLATFGPMDFASANFFTSMFPDSLFRKGPFCSRPNEMGGRYILMGGQLKYRDISGVTQTQACESHADVAHALHTHFGIDLPAGESVRP